MIQQFKVPFEQADLHEHDSFQQVTMVADYLLGLGNCGVLV